MSQKIEEKVRTNSNTLFFVLPFSSQAGKETQGEEAQMGAFLFVMLLFVVVSSLSQFHLAKLENNFLSLVGIWLYFTWQKLALWFSKFDAKILASRPVAKLRLRLQLPPITSPVVTLPLAKYLSLDLSFLIVALFAFDNVLITSFVSAIDDLINKGLIVFPEKGFGYTHLQVYIAGFISQATILTGLGLYGFHKGINAEIKSFLNLFLSTLSGYVLATLFLGISSHHKFTGFSNYQVLSQANGNVLPTGSRPLEVVIIVASFLIVAAFIACYMWVAYQAGRGTRRMFRKKPLSPRKQPLLRVLSQKAMQHLPPLWKRKQTGPPPTIQ